MYFNFNFNYYLFLFFFIYVKAEYHFKKHGVRVNAICPALVSTKLHQRIDETILSPDIWKSRKHLYTFLE